jgi:hypothetical protein
MVFTLSDLADDWPTVLANFITSGVEYKSVHNIFFATLYGHDSYLENRFLNLAYAAESYHRRRFSDRPLSSEAFGAIRGAVTTALDNLEANIPGAILDDMKAKVAFWNEHTLIQRLDALFPSADPDVGTLTGDTLAFLLLVKRTRNYLTHFSADSDAPTSETLLRLSMRLEALIRLLLLREIGVPPQAITRWALREATRINGLQREWS